MTNLKNTLVYAFVLVILLSCNQGAKKSETPETDENGYILLTDEQVENIVRRAYQYVALYNVNNKFAISAGGWNLIQADTQLKDHSIHLVLGHVHLDADGVDEELEGAALVVEGVEDDADEVVLVCRNTCCVGEACPAQVQAGSVRGSP